MKTESEIFSAQGLPAREQVTEWFKLKEKIGNQITGVFMGFWLSPASGAGFKEQYGVALKQADGKIIGVSVGATSYMLGRLETAIVGDSVGFRYEGDKDTGKPQPAKIVKFYNPDAEARHAKGETKITKPEVLNAPVGGALPKDDEDEDEPF